VPIKYYNIKSQLVNQSINQSVSEAVGHLVSLNQSSGEAAGGRAEGPSPGAKEMQDAAVAVNTKIYRSRNSCDFCYLNIAV